MSRRPGGAQLAPSWQRSILAVNLFLLARGGVAAGLVVQATRNHATDSEQEESDGQHCAGVRRLARGGAAARARGLSVRGFYVLMDLSTKVPFERRARLPRRRLAAVCGNI